MSEPDKSMRSALGRARYLGSARRGSQDAWLTKVTAAALIVLASGFVLMLLTLLSKDYNGVRDELGHPVAGDPDAAVRAGGDVPHAPRHALGHSRLSPRSRARMGADRQYLLRRRSRDRLRLRRAAHRLRLTLSKKGSHRDG